jgi:hypothetical protein
VSEFKAGDRSQLSELLPVVFPLGYVGPVYVWVQAPEPVETSVQLRWGPWSYARILRIDSQGYALMFSKLNEGGGQPPLRVVASQPVGIEARTGMPSGVRPERMLDCNDGWVQE